MRLRPEAKVGLIVFLALVAMAGVFLFLGGLRFRSGTYKICGVFSDVIRLSVGADVRMAGVRIGTVDSISLTSGSNARVEMRISRRYANSVPVDSTARITTGGVAGVGEYYVEIIPGARRAHVKPGGCIRTAEVPRLDDLLVQVQGIVGGLQGSISSVNKLLSDQELQQSLKNSIQNVEAATERTVLLVEDVRGTIASSRPEVERTLASVGSAAADFAAISRDLRVAVEYGGLDKVNSTLTSASRAAENLEVASRRLRELSEDETVAAQVRETLESTREAARGAADIVERIQRVIGGRRRGEAGPEVASGPVPGRGSRFDVLGRTESGDIRVDYNLTIPGRGDDFYRIGLFNIGEGTKLNLQLGEVLDQRSAIRYGLYASKLGVGYDRVLSNDLDLQLDFYRPNDPRLEAKLRYNLSPELGAWLGVEDVFGDGGGIIGLQYHR